MPYLIVGILLVLSVAALLALGGRAMAQKPVAGPADAGLAAEEKRATRPHPGVAASQKATRAELAARLKALKAAPRPPKDLQSAMCYEPPAHYTRAEYICPKDGERTVYAADATPSYLFKFLNEDLPAMRETVRSIQGLDVSLDESALCRRCTPQTKPDAERAFLGAPQVTLVIRFPGEAPRLLPGVRAGTVQLLAEFLSGTHVHSLSGPDTAPLADYADRIAEILGLDGTDAGRTR